MKVVIKPKINSFAIAKELRKFMVENKLSLRLFSSLILIQKDRLNKIISDNNLNLSANEFILICEYLNIPFEQLINLHTYKQNL